MRGSASRAVARAGARGVGLTPHADVFERAAFPEEAWPSCTRWHGSLLAHPSEDADTSTGVPTIFISIRFSGLSFCMPAEALGGRSRLLLLPVTLATRPREMCEMTRVKSQG